jgi:excisionase family DNA binding protein
MQETLVRVKDAAAILGLSPSTIRAMFLDGRLRRIKIGGATRIRKQEIDDMILYGYRLPGNIKRRRNAKEKETEAR